MLKPSMLKVALRPFLNRCFLELASIALQPSSHPFNLLLMLLMSCSVLFQLRTSNSPCGESNKCSPPTPVSTKHWKGTVKHSPLLVTNTELENFSQVFLHPLVFVVQIFSLPLSVSSHLNKLISRRLWLLICFFLLISLHPSFPVLSPHLSPPRGTVGVCGGWRWWWLDSEVFSRGL